jgi:GH35 family endo-1,4-beta-xylanase
MVDTSKLSHSFQLRHSFPFGSALKGQLIQHCVDSGEDDAYCTFAKVTGTRRSTLSFAKENFNFVVLENAMKWQSVEPERGQFRYSVQRGFGN